MITIKDNELLQEIDTTIENVTTIGIEVTQETAMIITDNRHIDNEHHPDNVIASEVSPDIHTNVTDQEIIINHRTDHQIINFHPINNKINRIPIHHPMPFNQCQ